mmetsp:Transcript_44772/g.114468  ORF Transcript_44772/g.114468 Transcript_44772/m.114468 type:complete len:330 (-) Transcript_44772:188-1177(-)
MATMEALKAELEEAKAQLVRETRRANNAIQELRHTKEQNLAVHKQVEQEEEFITNKLMKRLEQLKKEKQILANEVEQEEEFLTNTLQKRLEKVAREKEHMENQLEAEQEYIVNKLQKKLEALNMEKTKLHNDKVQLELQLEAEQEYIVNKLQTQVEALGREKSTMQTERMSLQKQVGRLTESVTKLSNEKVRLEQELESEEELIVNRMQRQIDDLLFNYKTLEKALRANGIFVPDSELIPMPYLAAQDRLTRWSPSFGRRGGPDFGGRWASRSLSASPARARAGSFSGGGSMQRRVSGEMGDRKSASAAGRLTTNKPTPSGAVPANTKN